MQLSPDDTKLTAYALGELDAAERAAIEASLAGSPEARAAVEEIRAAAGRLTTELAAEPCPELTPAQRAALETPAAAAKVVPFPSWRMWRTAGIAAAACVIGLAGWALFGPTPDTRQAKVASKNSNAPAIAQTQGATQHTEPKVIAGNVVIATNVVANSDIRVRSAALAQEGKLLFEAGNLSLAEAKLAEALRLDPSNGTAVLYVKLSQLARMPIQSLARQKLSQKLDSIRLPEIRYESLLLGQVVASLKQQAKAADPERKGVNIVVSTIADTDMTAVSIRIDPALNDLTLRQALDVIVKVADRPIKFSVEDYGVLISSATASPTVAFTQPLYASTGLPAAGNGSTVALDSGGASSGVYSVNAVGFGNDRKSFPEFNLVGGYGPGGIGGGNSTQSQGQDDSKRRRDGPAEYASVSVAGSGSRRSSFAQSLNQRVEKAQGGAAPSYSYYSPAPTTADGERAIDKSARLWDARTGNPVSQHPITAYAPFIENAFIPVLQEPLSTFSIDVDTASYANVRRFLNSGQLPPRDAVRIEELVNYFTYAYPAPRGEDPFSASIETAGCPWAPEHRLVRVALRGRELPRGKRPPSNFVFLIDVSGSMSPAERLPLLRQALRALVKKMGEGDRVAIVVYASEAGVKLESISCAEKEKILAVIDALEAGGSTNGGDGIQQAYAMARKNFIQGGVNRVLLCTDGDFNVGITDQNALVALVKENAATGVFLTTLGVGTDNYKDTLMQRLADRGNGNYHYLDTLEEANKVLIEQMNANLVTIAKDVKIQVEFNPAQVSAYRLIGYEKRMLQAQDFNNDRKDAGEIGAGHTVTAFYEILLAGKADLRPVVDKLKYQSAVAPASYSEKGEQSKELLTLKLRYKQPDGDTSRLIEFPHTDSGGSYGNASADFKFAASVASFGMILRGSEHKGSATFDTVLELAEEGKGADEAGWRAEFINLVKKAKGLRN